ncbi:3-oxo-5-alpha-steroid 4-dehydrogenase-domain-containing protein [Gloeopeniophorella convolvens]|nr:3-oxo-5-alpha-steroid 4-dehydrogenase-domain-containing protein [Gloeopeniophorella convolvens]
MTTIAQYLALVRQIDFEYVYSVTKRWFLFGFSLVGPCAFVYDAPFGRFATPNSPLSVDGIKAWIAMEVVSPLSFLFTTYLHPFSPTPFPLPSLALPAFGVTPQFLLTSFYIIHYLNRALVSPLRSPSRSKSHLTVVVSAIAFNIPNGFLLAAFLSSSDTALFLKDAFSSPRFWKGVALWAFGFVGNIYHDEILLNIRRKAIAKGKAKEAAGGKDAQQPHYAIPHGGLYSLISYPNYLSEWTEWFGFALAASPAPNFALLPGAGALLAVAKGGAFAQAYELLVPFADTVSPPWVFLVVEIATMIPRAVRGHRWYHDRFKESYPRQRRAVIPWLL